MKDVWGKKFFIHKGRVEVKCSICFKVIPVEEERLTANLGSGLYPKHFHLICFIKRYSKELVVLNDKMEKELNPSSRKELKENV